MSGNRKAPDDQGFLDEILRVLKMDKMTGILTARGERIMIIPVKLMRSIEDSLIRTFGPIAAANLLYEMGREAGRHSLKVLENRGHRITNPREFLNAREDLAPLWGWGRLHTMEFGPEKRLVQLRFTSSIYVRNRTGRTPACHFGRGMAAGSLGPVFGRRCESIEAACEGMGNRYCELVTGTPARIARVAENLNRLPESRA